MEESWVDAVRMEDYAEAAHRLELLDDARKNQPEVRYVRARVAMANGRYAEAHALFEGLDASLPLLAAEIARASAECALEAGPYAEAARYFGARSDAASTSKLGLALEKSGNLAAARAALTRALRAIESHGDAESRALEPLVRSARARVARSLKDFATAAKDLRWLAVEAPVCAAAKDAETGLAACVPPGRLSIDEHFTRAKRFAEAGRLDAALAEIDRAAAEHASPADVTRAKGFAYYVSRADYAKASELLDRAAKLDKDKVRDLFYAARALSRAQDDAGAIERYEALAKRYPGVPLAEEASYQAARLRFLLGQWDAAARSYRAYLDAHGKKKKGRFAAVARYELALTEMASSHADESVKLLEKLADSEDDPLDRASLHELEGAALALAGKRDRAVETLADVLRERPLSFPALMSAARLSALGVSDSPLLTPASDALRAPPLDVELPEKVALLARLGFVLDAERELSAHEDAIIVRYAPRGYEALCDAYGKIGAGSERYRVGRRVVKGDALERTLTDGNRWAWECVYPTPFDDVVRAQEQARNLPLGLLHAVMRQESAFRPDAVSPANAVGLLQLVPGTAEKVGRELGVDVLPELLRVPSKNVELGAFYLKKVLDRFGGHVALAAAAYNAGPRAVSRWLETGEELPLDLWVARIPYGETRGYVARVVGNLARYAYMRGGEAAIPKLSLELPKGVRASPDDY